MASPRVTSKFPLCSLEYVLQAVASASFVTNKKRTKLNSNVRKRSKRGTPPFLLMKSTKSLRSLLRLEKLSLMRLWKNTKRQQLSAKDGTLVVPPDVLLKCSSFRIKRMKTESGEEAEDAAKWIFQVSSNWTLLRNTNLMLLPSKPWRKGSEILYHLTVADNADRLQWVMDPKNLEGRLAQGKIPTSKSIRHSQHSSRITVMIKKATISLALLTACLMMIIIASTPFPKLMSLTRTRFSSLMSKGEVSISKGETPRDATPEGYQKLRYLKW